MKHEFSPKPSKDTQKRGSPGLSVPELPSLAGVGTTGPGDSPRASAASPAVPTPRSQSSLPHSHPPGYHGKFRAHCGSVGLNSWKHFYVFMALYLENSK